MPDIIFHNTAFALLTDVRHGQETLKGKLDTGSPISVFNLAALSIFLGMDEGDFRIHMKNSTTPVMGFKGYNGIPSDIYLSVLHNISIGSYFFKEFYVGISLDYPIGKDGKPITKVLLGMDVVNCGVGEIRSDGNLIFTITNEERQKVRMMDAFAVIDDNAVLVIDEL